MNSEELIGTAVVKRNMEVLASLVAGEVVIYNELKGAYFGLNQMGSKIWALLDSPRTIDSLVSELLSAFEVSPEQCRSDLSTFLEQMISKQLITIV